MCAIETTGIIGEDHFDSLKSSKKNSISSNSIRHRLSAGHVDVGLLMPQPKPSPFSRAKAMAKSARNLASRSRSQAILPQQPQQTSSQRPSSAGTLSHGAAGGRFKFL